MRIRRDDSGAGKVGLAAMIDTRRSSMKLRPPADGPHRDRFKPLRRRACRRVSGIVAGVGAIAADTALRPARHGDADARAWINLTAR
jgi:hypothetical protein